MIGYSVLLQENAIRKEWRDALELANRIERANPALFPGNRNGQDAVAAQAPAMLALLHLVMDDDATHETYVEEWAAILRAISPGE